MIVTPNPAAIPTAQSVMYGLHLGTTMGPRPSLEAQNTVHVSLGTTRCRPPQQYDLSDR